MNEMMCTAGEQEKDAGGGDEQVKTDYAAEKGRDMRPIESAQNAFSAREPHRPLIVSCSARILIRRQLIWCSKAALKARENHRKCVCTTMVPNSHRL